MQSKISKVAISILVHDHLNHGVPIRQNIFKIGTKSYSDFVCVARQMLKNGEIKVDADDKFFLEKLAAGQTGIFQGKKVDLDSPTRISDGKKKFRVYTNSGKKDKDGNIIAKKIEWGDPGLKIRNDDDDARKSFLARHQCHLKKDKTTPGWWACNVHLFSKQLGLKSDKPW